MTLPIAEQIRVVVLEERIFELERKFLYLKRNDKVWYENKDLIVLCDTLDDLEARLRKLKDK